MTLAIAIGVAGGLGALARYGLTHWTAHHWTRQFPLATLLINLTGAFALGLLLALGGARSGIPEEEQAVLGTGFLGGYTTFSTLSVETDSLIRRRYTGLAWLNGILSLVAGAAAAGLGLALGAVLTR